MLLGFDIYKGRINTINFEKIRIINTINPHSYCVSIGDSDFKNALLKSDILLPDGIGIVWAEKVLNGTTIKKTSGFDIFSFLMAEANKNKSKVFFLGSSVETLQKITEKASKDYPNVMVDSYSPPYKEIFSVYDSKIMFNKINDSNPDILFIGMTAPKQEKWVNQYKNEIKVNLICSIGAVFDFYSGTISRPSEFWVRLGLEWFIRFLNEPKRLWRRNFISSPHFIYIVIKEKLKSIMHI